MYYHYACLIWWKILICWASFGLWCCANGHVENVLQIKKKKKKSYTGIRSKHGKKLLNMLKVAVTQWLTHGRASKWILDCFCELMETIDQIGLNTAESKAIGYKILLTNHKVLFYVCFMTDVLSIINTCWFYKRREHFLLIFSFQSI